MTEFFDIYAHFLADAQFGIVLGFAAHLLLGGEG